MARAGRGFPAHSLRLKPAVGAKVSVGRSMTLAYGVSGDVQNAITVGWDVLADTAWTVTLPWLDIQGINRTVTLSWTATGLARNTTTLVWATQVGVTFNLTPDFQAQGGLLRVFYGVHGLTFSMDGLTTFTASDPDLIEALRNLEGEQPDVLVEGIT